MIINDSAKTVLCYGDSNTWGENPMTGERHPRSVRWAGVLQQLLGNDYEVISEGLCGRTFVATDPSKVHRTGITHLVSILESAYPVDYLVVMLGTNDVKTTYNLSAEQIAGHLEETIKLVTSNIDDGEVMPKIIIICPPPVIMPDSGNLDPRMINAASIFEKLPDLYRQVAEKYGCEYLNAGDYISSSKVDGYHLDADAHSLLAEKIKEKVLRNTIV